MTLVAKTTRMRKSRRCPACKGEGGESYTRIERYETFDIGVSAFRRCERCDGTGRLAPKKTRKR